MDSPQARLVESETSQNSVDKLDSVINELFRISPCANRRPCFLAGLANWILGLPLAGMAAYLPIIGPAPLNFQVPPAPPSTLVLALPKTEIPLVPPTGTAPGASTLTTATNQDTAPAVVLTSKSPALNETNETVQAPGDSGAGSEELLSPQMMVPFFQKSLGETNGVKTEVFGPVNFIPPVPRTPPASKATYSTP